MSRHAGNENLKEELGSVYGLEYVYQVVSVISTGIEVKQGR